MDTSRAFAVQRAPNGREQCQLATVILRHDNGNCSLGLPVPILRMNHRAISRCHSHVLSVSSDQQHCHYRLVGLNHKQISLDVKLHKVLTHYATVSIEQSIDWQACKRHQTQIQLVASNRHLPNKIKTSKPKTFTFARIDRTDCIVWRAHGEKAR